MTKYTKLTYAYRDVFNNKFSAEAVLAGALTARERGRIHAALENGQFFLPSQVGLPNLVLEMTAEIKHYSYSGWAPWHELISLTVEDDPDGDLAPGIRVDGDLPDGWFDDLTPPTGAQVAAAFPDSAAGWQTFPAATKAAEALTGSN